MTVPPTLVFEGNYTIRTSEVNSQRQATPTALIHLMQEAALENVIHLKVSAWDLEEAHISWVLMRKHLDIRRLPRLGETITIRTFPAGFQRVFSYRDYEVRDAAGTVIAQSASTWLLMDTQTRNMAPIPQAILDQGTFDNSDCLPHAKAKLPLVTAPSTQQEFRVNWHDMDFNEHLSNTRYMQWLFETVPGYTSMKQNLQTLDIIYKSECHWKDRVNVATQDLGEGQYLHLLTRLSDGEEIARAQTSWATTS